MEAIEPALSSWGHGANHLALLLSCFCHPCVIVAAVTPFAVASEDREKALTSPSRFRVLLPIHECGVYASVAPCTLHRHPALAHGQSLTVGGGEMVCGPALQQGLVPSSQGSKAGAKQTPELGTGGNGVSSLPPNPAESHHIPWPLQHQINPYPILSL